MITKKPAAPIRSIAAIASDIYDEWGANVSNACRPYLTAMYNLDTIDDKYFADDARTVLLYFLSNAGGFRGDRARELKAELKRILKEPRS